MSSGTQGTTVEHRLEDGQEGLQEMSTEGSRPGTHKRGGKGSPCSWKGEGSPVAHRGQSKGDQLSVPTSP